MRTSVAAITTMENQYMLNEATIAKLNIMRLYGMAAGFVDRTATVKSAGLSHEEFFGLLVDDEKNYRDNAKLARLLTRARLKQTAALEDIDYRHPRGLDKHIMADLCRAMADPVSKCSGHGPYWRRKKFYCLRSGKSGLPVRLLNQLFSVCQVA